MAKSKGTLFSKSLIGYKRADVNEYIRQSDEDHADEITELKDEILKLENHVLRAEAKIKELESMLEKERASAAADIRKLTEASNQKLAEAEKTQAQISDKLSETEARATSYLKLADSSSLRAESAEAEVTLLSAGLESARVEIEELKTRNLEDEKKITELEKIVGRYAAQEEMNKAERGKYFVIRRPSFMRFIRRK